MERGKMMSREVVLSDRLTALTKMVTGGSRVCDVGCDHGFLSIYLVQKRIAPSVIAMDLREGPLSRAREHIAEAGLENYIQTRLSDGVTALESGEADALVCAGMGGRLMMRILAQGREKCRAMKELILQPQSELPQFRRFLRQERYRTVREDMVEEDGKFYFMMKVIPVEDVLACQESLYENYGELLLEKKHPVLMHYLQYRQGVVAEILQNLREKSGESAKARLAEVEKEKEELKMALRRF